MNKKKGDKRRAYRAQVRHLNLRVDEPRLSWGGMTGASAVENKENPFRIATTLRTRGRRGRRQLWAQASERTLPFKEPFKLRAQGRQ